MRLKKALSESAAHSLDLERENERLKMTVEMLRKGESEKESSSDAPSPGNLALQRRQDEEQGIIF